MRKNIRTRLSMITLWFLFLFLSLTLAQAQDKLAFEADDSIIQLRDKISNNGYSFSVGHNWVYDLSQDDKAKLLSRHPPLNPRPAGEPEEIGPIARHLGKAALPAQFDWRSYNGKSYIGPVKDQDTCGACYAFGANAAAEGVYNWAKNKPDGNCVNFSESYIIWCLGRLSQYSNHFFGCDGADYDYEELHALTVEGVANTSNFPYQTYDPGSCTHWSDPTVVFKEWHRIPCGDINAIKTAIMTYGVVDAAVYVGSAFEAYHGGIYEDTNTSCNSTPCYYTPTNHAISLVGWNDNGGNGYWILRNSWGQSWGENGYMRIRYTSAVVSCEAAYLVPSTSAPAPAVNSFSPTSGATRTTVTITGTNLSGATAVSFGGTAAQSFTVDSATQITAVTGTGTTGTISVTTPGGTATSSGTFTCVWSKVNLDFNVDGKSDTLWRHATTGEVYLWTMNGATISSLGSVAIIGDLNWKIQGIGDFNGDGKADILWRNTATGEVWIYLMNGPAIASQGSVGFAGDSNLQIQGIGDFNGDGKVDILWRNAATGEVSVWLMNGATVTTKTSVGTVGDLNWKIQGVGDFNGDGKADILWRHTTTGQVWLYLMNGPAISAQGSVGVVSDLNWQIQGIGDFNGDGKADILWRNAATGQVWIYLMNGTAISAQGSVGVVGDMNWKIQGIGDFNGDGKADILWRHTTSGQVWLYLMNGPAISSQSSVSVVSDLNWKIQLLFGP
ncbi:MAG: FG-GAP repeat protein [Deltaproteobacteria bacterium]|nr:FG-GAP repeat protein [Deltaproteobacteria bacterium]